MPTTDLPLRGAEKGTAGMKWQPNGSTSRPEQVHAFNYPPELIPGGGLESADRKFRAQSRSIDGSNLETWTVGGSTGTEEITLRVRFDGWPESLLDLVGDAHDGVTIDYYPRLESTNLSFPSELLGVEGVARIREDEDRFSHAEYQADLRLKDASSDSQGYWWLKSPNKFKNPRLARGTTDGVAERWSLQTNQSYASFSIDKRAQRVTITSADDTAPARVSQNIEGVIGNDDIEYSFEYRMNSTDVQLNIFIGQSGGPLIDGGTANHSTSFTRFTNSQTASTGVTSWGFRFEPTPKSTGVSGSVWFRDAKLTLQ